MPLTKFEVPAAGQPGGRREEKVGIFGAQVIATDEVAALQEVGIYEYRHPLQDAVAYKSRLADIKDTAKAMVTAKTAVTSATSWTVNGSAQKARP